VSFDIFVQGFRDGDASQLDATQVMGSLAPYASEAEGAFARLTFADGEADLFGWDDLASGFMINHVSGRIAWDVLVDLARRLRLAILVAGFTAVVHDSDLADLPEELRADAVIIGSGAELLSRVEGS